MDLDHLPKSIGSSLIMVRSCVPPSKDLPAASIRPALFVVMVVLIVKRFFLPEYVSFLLSLSCGRCLGTTSVPSIMMVLSGISCSSCPDVSAFFTRRVILSAVGRIFASTESANRRYLHTVDWSTSNSAPERPASRLSACGTAQAAGRTCGQAGSGFRDPVSRPLKRAARLCCASLTLPQSHCRCSQTGQGHMVIPASFALLCSMPWITSLMCSSDVSVSERPASVTAHRPSSRSSCCSRSRPIVFSRLLIAASFCLIALLFCLIALLFCLIALLFCLIAVSFCLIALLFCLIAVSFCLSSLCSLRIVCSEDSITCCGDQNGSKSFGKIFMIQLCIKSLAGITSYDLDQFDYIYNDFVAESKKHNKDAPLFSEDETPDPGNVRG